MAAAWLVRQLNAEMVELGASPVPYRHVTSWSQLRSETVPRGFIGHEELANGVRLRKTDPGPLFPWERFLAMCAAEEDGPDLTAVDERLAAAEASLATARERLEAGEQEIAAARSLLRGEA